MSEKVKCPVCKAHDLTPYAWRQECCCGECGHFKDDDYYDCANCGPLRKDVVDLLLTERKL